MFDFNKLKDKQKIIYMSSYIAILTEFIHKEYNLPYDDIPDYIGHFAVDLMKKKGGK